MNSLNMQLSKKEQKRLYDIEYRRKNSEIIKIKKAAYCKTDAGRAMQKRNRTKVKQYHLEYCQTPEYRELKKQYDRKHRAYKFYGEFAECMILCDEIETLVVKMIPDKYQRDIMRGNIARMQAKRAMKRHFKNGWEYNWNHVLELSN